MGRIAFDEGCLRVCPKMYLAAMLFAFGHSPVWSSRRASLHSVKVLCDLLDLGRHPHPYPHRCPRAAVGPGPCEVSQNTQPISDASIEWQHSLLTQPNRS